MAFAEAVGQPGVDCAEAERAGLCGLLDSRDVLQHPGHLRCREVGGERQAGALLHKLFCIGMGALQLLAERSVSPALPDDGTAERLSRHAVPGNAGLALVGDAKGHDLRFACMGIGDCRAHAGADIGEDLLWIMLDPALVVHILAMGEGGGGDHLALLVEEERLRALGRLVEGKDKPACAAHLWPAFASRSLAEEAMPAASSP